MKQIRWYDKNPNLKDIFEFLEGLDKKRQKIIAQDVIQILMNDFGLNLDSEINKISENYIYDCKRWYDKDIDLFSSFEIIKSFPQKKQNEIAKKIVETILFIYLKEGD